MAVLMMTTMYFFVGEDIGFALYFPIILYSFVVMSGILIMKGIILKQLKSNAELAAGRKEL